MMKLFAEPRSLITADIGNINTQVSLFDTVSGRYRYLATGKAITTAFAPIYNFQDGLLEAFFSLEKITGQSFLNQEGQLLMPAAEGKGVDNFGATFSAGEPIKVLAVGLLNNVSLQSAKKILQKVPTTLVGTVSLSSMERVEKLVDQIVSKRPELIFITGGTDQGAAKSVLGLVNILRMAIYLMPQNQRPIVLYAGNNQIAPNVNKMLASFTKVYVADNLRPSLKVENLEPATQALYQIFKEIQIRKIHGLETLNLLSSEKMLPASLGYRNMFKYLAKTSNKKILGVNLSSSGTLVSYAVNGNYDMRVFSDFGTGIGLQASLKKISTNDILKWIPLEVNKNDVSDFVQNRILFSKSVPCTVNAMKIENALTVSLIRKSLADSQADFPKQIIHPNHGNTLQWFDKIYLSGYALVRSLENLENLVMILNAIQPCGITELLIDKNNLFSSLGAAAMINPLLTVQVLENSLISLAHVITPVGKMNSQLPVLQMKITTESGNATVYEFKAGMLYRIPLKIGKQAKIEIQPLQKTDIGWGRGRGGVYPEWIKGSMLGIVVDTRGRPFVPMQSKRTYQAVTNQWLQSLHRRMKI